MDRGFFLTTSYFYTAQHGEWAHYNTFYSVTCIIFDTGSHVSGLFMQVLERQNTYNGLYLCNE